LIGFWTCVALVVGNTIGRGVFLPASLAPYGLNSVVAWILTACASVCSPSSSPDSAALTPLGAPV
jgi:APA family basic amino acid/polyamine antiporter